MLNGKKHKAQETVYEAMDVAAAKLKKDQLAVIEEALDNVIPLVEVRARRIGGASYQIPTEINPHRRQSLGVRWLVQYARQRTGMPIAQKLAAEIVDAYNKTGSAHKKREDTHKMADANKALAHYSKF